MKPSILWLGALAYSEGKTKEENPHSKEKEFKKWFEWNYGFQMIQELVDNNKK